MLSPEGPTPPKTPPHRPTYSPANLAITPEQVRRTEINRLKAKALREEHEAGAAARKRLTSPLPDSARTSASQKRKFATFNAQTPATNRDARSGQAVTDRPLETIQPARNFAKYVEYDFSKMTDTKGGFLTADDDPQNKALYKDEGDVKPAHMTMKEWERQRMVQSLETRKEGPFEPGINALQRDEAHKQCRECKSLEIDWKWEEILHCAVCNVCKDKHPEKYSLLTKTEAKDDYLLTDRKFPTIPFLMA